MGEYANYAGQRVKIGTCEEMLYLRWDQRALVTESETPLFDPEVLKSLRFRFPWPKEDDIVPGHFEDPFQAFALYGFEQPKDMDHGMVQFSASNGYLVSLPCPEAAAGRTFEDGLGRTYTVHRNGYGGPASLIGQAWRGGRLVGIARCNGCHYPYRLEEGYEEAAAVAIRARADEEYRTADNAKARGQNSEGNRDIGDELHEIANRLLAGYKVEVPA